MSIALEEVLLGVGMGKIPLYTICNTKWKQKKSTEKASQFPTRKTAKYNGHKPIRSSCPAKYEWGFAELFQPHPSLEWGGGRWIWVRGFRS